MSSIKPSSRYSSFDSRSSATSSLISDPSLSSSDLKNSRKNQTTLKHLMGISKLSNQTSETTTENISSKLTRTKSYGRDHLSRVIKNEQNLSSMVRKFMEKKSKSKPNPKATNQMDFDTVTKGSNFSSFHKKMFQKGSPGMERNGAKALTEVKSNTRTLAMVLRSERELLSHNKEYETEIMELKFIIAERNREVEKLRDLCLNQREEIKTLKNAVLFPDAMNSHLQELLEKQGSEFIRAKQVIPTLQQQVTSLTGKLQCLAEDLAEVKADKSAVRTSKRVQFGSTRTPIFDQEARNSMEYSFGDHTTTPGSSDDMFLNDFNPCLTPYYTKLNSKECNGMTGYDSPQTGLLEFNSQVFEESCSSSQSANMYKSSEYSQSPSLERATALEARRSDRSRGKWPEGRDEEKSVRLREEKTDKEDEEEGDVREKKKKREVPLSMT
ncbi:hypothetical protein GIB67_013401 [Kingdonia uniflora]|uniref:Uncharacterized protein n=1 Tax=Kingdonia uniflora TaxID=39325 RepID=A0A7J7LR70_9MAGN|nr:hypothetical protein GIB67_013401 [Kingdonia uniflora]